MEARPLFRDPGPDLGLKFPKPIFISIINIASILASMNVVLLVLLLVVRALKPMDFC